MGKIKKSIARKIAEGDTRKVGVRKLQAQLQSQPKAARGLPDCPEHLQGRARAAWTFLQAELEAMDLDRRPDALTLEGGCLAYAAAIEAEELLAREGSVIEIGGDRKAHPGNRQRNQAWARFTQFADRFGLSPRAREALSVERPDAGDEELAAILSRPRPPKPIKENVQ